MIKVGDRLPEGKVRIKAEDGTATELTTADLFGGKTVVLVGVPGAFTSTCHNAHIPQFIANADAFRGKGVGVLLVARAVDDARAAGKTIIPLCPFAAAQFRRHPEWADVLKK